MPDHSITLNNVPIEWDLSKGELKFFGIASTLFWNDPSLLRMLHPLANEVGVPLFKLLVAHSSSFGTSEDYHAMINSFSDNFAEGFLKWGEAVSAAGWGVFELDIIDYENKTAKVTISNPWELMMLQSLSEPSQSWGCPFMLGKIIGIFSHAFGVPVWADENASLQELKVEFFIYPSKKTIEEEIDRLRRDRMDECQQVLNSQVAEKTRQLQQAREELETYTHMLEKKVEERTRQLQLLSITDETTGLFNRRHFNKIFQDEINRAKRGGRHLTFLLFDIDCFKQYNDTYGHIKGDKVLEKVGKLLSSLAKRAGDFVFRVGRGGVCATDLRL